MDSSSSELLEPFQRDSFEFERQLFIVYQGKSGKILYDIEETIVGIDVEVSRKNIFL